MKLGGERLGAQESVSKCLQVELSGHRLWNMAKKPDKAGVTREKAERSDMSGLDLWNSDKELDKAERPDMSRLGARHVQLEPLESGLGAGYVWLDRRFWW
jgi:hypothetical protein